MGDAWLTEDLSGATGQVPGATVATPQVHGFRQAAAPAPQRVSPPNTPLIHCAACQYQGKRFDAHHGYRWWHLAVGFLAACSGVGIIPLAILMIYLGNRTFVCCPRCGRRDSLYPWTGLPSPVANRTWDAAHQADAVKLRKNKLILFAVVMAMLLLAVVFAILMVQAQGGRL